MPTIAERNDRMTRILADRKSAVMWVQGFSNRSPSIHDSDGDCMTLLPDPLVDIIDRVSDADAGAIVEAIGDIISAVRKDAFRTGELVGRERAVHQVHEFLGITRLCDAIMRSADRSKD